MDPAKGIAVCAICSDYYNESSRTPKFLQCFHTACSTCIETLASHSSVPCPFCRKETPLGSGGVSDLQTNFYILNHLAELTREAGIQQQATESAREKPLEWCQSCNCLVCGPDCKSAGHVCSALTDTALEAMHLRTLVFLCTSRWTTISNSEQQVQKYLKAGLQALHQIQQELVLMQRNNTSKLKVTQQYLSELDAAAKFVENDQEAKKDRAKVQSLLETFSGMYREGQEELQGVAQLASCLDNLEKGSAAVQYTDRSSTEKTLQSLCFGIPVEDNWRTFFSFMLLKETCPEKLEILKGTNITSPKSDATQGTLQQQTASASSSSFSREDKKKETVVKQKPANVPKKGPNKKDDKQTNTKHGKEGTKPCKELDSGLQRFASTPFVSCPPPQLAPSLMKKNVIFEVSRNGQFFGTLTFQLCTESAPVMCAKFLQFCQPNQLHSYHGSSFHGAKANEEIYGGRIRGFTQSFCYPADRCPLQRGRGAVSMRLMADFKETKRFIVGCEFTVHLGPKPKPAKESTVFAYVTDGLGLCEIMSQLDVATNNFLFNKITVV